MADPLPLPVERGGYYVAGKRYDVFHEGQMRAYGDAREAAGRRAALLEASEWIAGRPKKTDEPGPWPRELSLSEIADALKERANRELALADQGHPRLGGNADATPPITPAAGRRRARPIEFTANEANLDPDAPRF